MLRMRSAIDWWRQPLLFSLLELWAAHVSGLREDESAKGAKVFAYLQTMLQQMVLPSMPRRAVGAGCAQVHSVQGGIGFVVSNLLFCGGSSFGELPEVFPEERARLPVLFQELFCRDVRVARMCFERMHAQSLCVRRLRLGCEGSPSSLLPLLEVRESIVPRL